MENVKQFKEEFLLDMLEYYTTDTERRCVMSYENKSFFCKYSPKSLGISNKSEGCAIGRKLSPELALELDNKYGGDEIKEIYEKFSGELPEWINEKTLDFLSSCQVFHDSDSYWTESGLSETGVIKLGEILHVENLSTKPFLKYLQCKQ